VPLSLVCTSRCVPLPVCDHSQGVYFPPNRRRSIVFRVLFQQTNKQIKQARKTRTTFLRLGTRPSRNLPTQRCRTTSLTASKDNLPAPRDTPLGEPPDAKAPHDQPDSQQGQPSCAWGHGPQRTSQRKDAARPARQDVLQHINKCNFQMKCDRLKIRISKI